MLKCEQGFVGYKANGSQKLECNKASYETIKVEKGDNGQVYFKSKISYHYFSDNYNIIVIQNFKIISYKYKF